MFYFAVEAFGGMYGRTDHTVVSHFVITRVPQSGCEGVLHYTGTSIYITVAS